MKISTLTLNPVLDKTMYFKNDVKFKELNRAAAPSVTTVGGKGTNASCVLKSLGINAAAYGFIGGDNGDMFVKLLAPYGIHTDFVRTKCETRHNIKIITENGEATEFNETGGPVDAFEKKELFDKIEAALNDCDLFFMGGSVPAGIEKSVYKDILNLGANAKFIVDCDGEALKLCMENAVKPFAIKPNLYELEQFLSKSFDLDNSFEAGLEEIKIEIKKIYDDTGVMVLCSLGKFGGLYCGDMGVCYKCAPKVKLRGFTGAGDTFLAVFIAGYFGLFDLPKRQQSLEADALAFAVAAASAKVTKPGTEFATIGEMIEMHKNIT
jgi:1-phosphofructokinase